MNSISSRSDTLKSEVFSVLPDDCSIEDIKGRAASITTRYAANPLEENVIDHFVDAAVKTYSPSGPNDLASVRRLAHTMMLLSFLAFNLNDSSSGRFKAVAAAIHLAIDALADYPLSVAYCSAISDCAASVSASDVSIIANGDMGIALGRWGRLREARLPLANAIQQSLEVNDHSSAARYESELGLVEFKLGESSAVDHLKRALTYAAISDSPDLVSTISANLQTIKGARG